MVNWAELPNDLIAQIAKRVKVIEDFIAFGAVCTSWRTVASKDNFDVFSPQVPLLMLADKDEDYREFYSLSKGKVSRILFLPEARGRRCFASKGWLFTISCNGEFYLLHPFSRTQIQLPSQKALLAIQAQEGTWSCMDRAVLSASPSVTSDYILVISYFRRDNCLSFWRPGDLNWTNIIIDWGALTGHCYYKGQFYAVSWSGEVWVFDIPGPGVPQPIVELRLLMELEDDIWHHHSGQFYLVELCGALLLVTRFADYHDPSTGYETCKFKVFELDVIKGELKGEIKTLGESAIFLGMNEASSIDSSKSTGVKPSYIYFTDDWYDHFSVLEGGGGRDMGAYNLEDGKIESFYPGLSLSPICPPTWVTPSF